MRISVSDRMPPSCYSNQLEVMFYQIVDITLCLLFFTFGNYDQMANYAITSLSSSFLLEDKYQQMADF